MFLATLRGMLAHKLRLALTTASIALGVAFLAGTLVLTDTMNLAFDQLFGKVSSGTDAVVRTKAAYTQSEGTGTSHAPISEKVIAAVSEVDGVRAAEGSVSGYALLTDKDGAAITTNGGAPTMGYSMPADEQLRGDVSLLSGAAPSGPGQVAIDATSAEDNDIALGTTIKVLFEGPTKEFEVVGTVGFGGEKDLGGTTSAYFDTITAQQVLGEPGVFDEIDVSAEQGVSQSVLADRLSSVVPTGAEAVTGATVAQEASDAIQDDLQFVTIMFSIFAGVALFVGAFIIWNTFTMVVTQRSREIALLRAVGATRRQVMRSLITEALLLGLIASAIGIGLGILVAKGLNALMSAVGFSLPSTSLQIEPRTIWVSMIVGTLVTVVSALVPARRATKVLPIEALRDSVVGTTKPSKVRAAAGVLITAAGAAALLFALYGDAPFIVFGLGLLASIVGVITMMPLLSRPLASVIAKPIEMRGMSGELAKQNAMRNPKRTASTAAALMIGLTLVVSMGVFASSLKTSFGDVIADSTNADLFLTASSIQSLGYSPEVNKEVAEVPGVETVSANGWGEARFNGGGSTYSAIDPKTSDEAIDLGMTSGSVENLGTDGVVVSKATADSEGWKVGDTVSSEFAETGKHDLEVVGIYDNKGWISDNYVISLDAQREFAGQQLSASGLVLLASGADQAEVKDAIDAVLVDHPDAQILDQGEYEEVASGFIDQLLTFVTVMLLFAVVIALLGIVNTLVLSVFERTRELGLLRAVGMTRTQVRSMVRWESVVISLIGAVTGAVLGIGIGLALAQALKDEGIKAINVPWLQVIIYVALAAIAGVVAAIGPARAASKVDVLKAVVTE